VAVHPLHAMPEVSDLPVGPNFCRLIRVLFQGGGEGNTPQDLPSAAAWIRPVNCQRIRSDRAGRVRLVAYSCRCALAERHGSSPFFLRVAHATNRYSKTIKLPRMNQLPFSSGGCTEASSS